jgi:S1-C subfamily serine protease
MKRWQALGGLVLAGFFGLAVVSPADAAAVKGADPKALAEEFGAIVGPVTEDIRKELNLRTSEGVAVFEIIGDSLADLAGIKVKSVIAEINNQPVRDLDAFGRLLSRALAQGNATIGSWEPASPEDQGAGQQMNFHFIPNRQD